jgi:hypothetical protein
LSLNNFFFVKILTRITPHTERQKENVSKLLKCTHGSLKEPNIKGRRPKKEEVKKGKEKKKKFGLMML